VAGEEGVAVEGGAKGVGAGRVAGAGVVDREGEEGGFGVEGEGGGVGGGEDEGVSVASVGVGAGRNGVRHGAVRGRRAGRGMKEVSARWG
jgi:hypothetical protein